MNSAIDDAETVSPLQSYLELLRLPNVFTAAADVAMGFFFVQAAWAFNIDVRPPSLRPIGIWTIGLLIVASASLYLAGMVLNDVFDIELDHEEQPYRPLPSGRISLERRPVAGLEPAEHWRDACRGCGGPAGARSGGPRRQPVHHLAAGPGGGGIGGAHCALQRRIEADDLSARWRWAAAAR